MVWSTLLDEFSGIAGHDYPWGNILRHSPRYDNHLPITNGYSRMNERGGDPDVISV
jgi:hypothetical protein